MSLETQVADLVTATNSLTGTVNTKIADIDAAKNAAVADMNAGTAAMAAVVADLPNQVNTANLNKEGTERRLRVTESHCRIDDGVELHQGGSGKPLHVKTNIQIGMWQNSLLSVRQVHGYSSAGIRATFDISFCLYDGDPAFYVINVHNYINEGNNGTMPSDYLPRAYATADGFLAWEMAHSGCCCTGRWWAELFTQYDGECDIIEVVVQETGETGVNKW